MCSVVFRDLLGFCWVSLSTLLYPAPLKLLGASLLLISWSIWSTTLFSILYNTIQNDIANYNKQKVDHAFGQPWSIWSIILVNFGQLTNYSAESPWAESIMDGAMILLWLIFLHIARQKGKAQAVPCCEWCDHIKIYLIAARCLL